MRAQLFVTVRFRLPYGRVKQVEIDVLNVSPVDFLTGEEPGIEVSPVERNTPKGTGDRGSGPPVPPLTGENRGSPSPSGDVSRADRDLETEIADARQALSFWSVELSAIDEKLSPSRDERKNIEAAILGTHRKWDGRVIAEPSRAPLRTELWQRLDDHTAKWGPLRAKRREADREVRILTQHINHLTRAFDRKSRKAAA